MPAQNLTTPTVEVLNALQAHLSAVQYAGSPAFDQVELYDLADLAQAIKDLLLVKNRICLVVLDSESWEPERKGQQLICRQAREVTLLVADRHWASSRVALLGNVQTAGVLGLKDALLPELTGLITAKVFAQPGLGELMKVSDGKQHRIAWRQPFTLIGGSLAADIGIQPF